MIRTLLVCECIDDSSATLEIADDWGSVLRGCGYVIDLIGDRGAAEAEIRGTSK